MRDCCRCNGNGDVICPSCHGKGHHQGEPCISCQGEGSVQCMNCSGTGSVEDYYA